MFNRKNKKEAKKEPEKPTTWYGKVWYFIWHEDSLASWIVNIILAYVIIKFIIYPGLGFVFGTHFPIVAVVSDSMEHNGAGFDQWWASHEDYYLALNITKDEFENYPFKNGFNRGDIMFLVGKNPEDIKLGDIIVFQSKKSYPIIHRVISKENKSTWVFQTKGDNNNEQIREYDDPSTPVFGMARLVPGQEVPTGFIPVLDETNILEKTILGKAAVRAPFLGYVKIWFVDLMQATGIYGLFHP